MDKKISQEDLKQFETQFDENRSYKIAMNAVTKNGVKESAMNYRAAASLPQEFSVSLKQGKVTNQKKSGRCWMFAALNFMRAKVIQDLNLETFELSQNYTLFYDKLEKANYFLENILATLDEPTDGRLIAHLLADPLGDGGQWDMLCNIIEKYGLVPKYVMPETAVSSATADMRNYMTKKMREYACRLRRAHREGATAEQLRAQKDAMLSESYRMLCICLGKPPKTFDFEYRDKDGGFHRDTNLTPQEFYKKYIGISLGDYISVINAPTEDKPYYRSYTVQCLGNVAEGRPVKYVNLPINELKKAAIAQLQSGEPVWFGCDCGQGSSREGMMDTKLYDVEDLFDTTFPMTKAERLTYRESLMDHAMTLQGVNLDENGKPNRWRIENSWGDEAGRDGFYVMSDRWFDEFTYQIVVNRKYLPKEALAAYDSEPIVLAPWDPMGSLA